MEQELNIPPTDGGRYYFDEASQTWLPVEIDHVGLELTPERVESLKPFESWVKDESGINWIAPVARPDNILDENGNVDFYFEWDEQSISWVEKSTKPYPSWIRSEDGRWVPPVELDDSDGVPRRWSEQELKWVKNPSLMSRYGAMWDVENRDFIDVLDTINFKFDPQTLDASWDSQQWPSWTQGEDGRWRAPVQYPDNGKLTNEWDEYEQEWFDPFSEIDISTIIVPRLINGEENEQQNISS